MSDNPPPLPTYVSRDGSELWDWAADMGGYFQREAKKVELRQSIRDLDARCGTCVHWMKSSVCPRERPGTGKRSGYSVGPSMSDVPCDMHSEEPWVTRLRAERQAALVALRA